MLRQDDLTSPTSLSVPISEPFDRWPAIEIPPRLRLLCIGPDEPLWVSLTLQLDAEGCLEP
ncbi:MAG: hypothetical protein HZA46_13845 [Planctomycetales bacterium]|nr:hypothetical protein [Planctomycetales bacterium]